MTLIETLNKPERDEGESMTRQELRARLFETLRTAGIADKLKVRHRHSTHYPISSKLTSN